MKNFILGILFCISTFSFADAPFNAVCNNNRSRCDVYLASDIVDQGKYNQLYYLIESAPANGVIYMHLQGNGGHMSTVMRLRGVYGISRAKIVSVVEGPVYSAHAFIAMLSNKLIIMPNTLFLFHMPAYQRFDDRGRPIGGPLMYKVYCNTMRGTDRGVNARLKCLQDSAQENNMYLNLFRETVFPYLTPNEINRMLKGEDIMINGSEMAKRLRGRK